jgi:hypothetical protein
MVMKKKVIVIILAGVVICLAVSRLAVSVGERGRSYEIQPMVTLPEYGGEAGRTIDAYERLMERYMDLAETRISECNESRQKLDSIDSKIDRISERLAKIEKAMGIDPNGNIETQTTKAKDVSGKIKSK